MVSVQSFLSVCVSAHDYRTCEWTCEFKAQFLFFFFSSGWWNPSVLSVITQPTASIFNLHFYPSFLLIYDLPLISFPIPSIFPSCSSLSPSDPTLSEYGPRRLPVSLVCRRLQRLLLLSDPPGQGRRTIPSVPITSRPESSAQQAAAAAASDAGPPAGYHPLIACIPLSFNLLTPFGCPSHGCPDFAAAPLAIECVPLPLPHWRAQI